MTELYKNFSVALGAVLLTGSAFLGGAYLATPAPAPQAAAAAQSQPFAVELEDSSLRAKAAILYDISSARVLYQKEGYEQLPLASLTKLMVAEVVLSVLSPDTEVTITAKDLKPEGDSKLRVGQKIGLDELLALSLVASSNDAITAAANALGDDAIERMNETAKTLGLNQTHFFNPTGLDVSAKTSGAYGSAYDVARLAAIFYKHHPTYFELTTRPEVVVAGQGAEATTAALQDIPGFVAAKTGYTDLAGGNLVAVFDLQPGLTVVAVALGSTREGRFADVEKIIAAARASL